ncbi:uridine kinase family protein [Candidatus Poriferisodalis sp.]|uniref:uridine kinase family protein n=1 Tax=Candidatus Poriferisodalis sp. TaxID=3101277 RepID=UPI003B5B027E
MSPSAVSQGGRIGAADIVGLVAPAGSPVRVGIDGPGGSGKSRLAAELVRCWPADVALVHGDDFGRPTVDPARSEQQIGGLFDLSRLERDVLEPHERGAPIRYRRYDWSTDRPGEWVTAPHDNALIVEGVYCAHPSIRDRYHFLIWVEADRPTRLARGLARDGQAAQTRWEDIWMPVEDRYRSQHRPGDAAHLVLDSTNTSDSDELTFQVTGGRRLPE